MACPDRREDCYRLAAESGLRWSELRSLTRGSFNFTADPATITVRAASTKNRKDATLPLRPELSADLRALLTLHLPGAKAFAGAWKDKGADMIREDMVAAGIPIADADGFPRDFHALRHTFASLMAKAGGPIGRGPKADAA